MAKKSNVTALAKRGPTELANWEETMAADAKKAAELETMPGGQFISMMGGQFSIAGNEVKDNILKVVILDHIVDRTYYPGGFDADNPTPPTCWALGRDKEADDLVPDDEVEKKQNDDCKTCPKNKWGSDGKGKACKEKRRLALIAADPLNENSLKDGELLFFRVPPTSLGPWGGYLKGLDANFKRPSYGVVTEMSLKKKKTWSIVNFNFVDLIDKALGGVVMKRRGEAMESIEFPYQKPSEVAEEEGPKKKRKFK